MKENKMKNIKNKNKTKCIDSKFNKKIHQPKIRGAEGEKVFTLLCVQNMD